MQTHSNLPIYHSRYRIGKDQVFVNKVIDDGAKVCKILKKFYPEYSWMNIAETFNKLKYRAKGFHPDCDNEGIVIRLSKYTEEEIKEALECFGMLDINL